MIPEPSLADFRAVPQEAIARGATTAELPTSPYPGLRPFRLEEWPIFFGRETMIEEIVARLHGRAVVFVHGASGCGKSSLIYAGVLPSLARRARRQKLKFAIVEMRPGRAPLSTLAAAVASAGVGLDVAAAQQILALGRDAGAALALKLQEAGVDRLYVFVDQFEEIFRFARHVDPTEAALFIEVLVGLSGISGRPQFWEEMEDGDETPTAAPLGPVRLLVTMRSEFLGDCVRFSGLTEIVNLAQYLLPGMARRDLLRAVRKPIELFHGSVATDLAEKLVADALLEDDPLPLIQHSLARLWSGPGVMTLAAYQTTVEASPEQLDLPGGQLSRLLAAHADQVLAACTPAQRDVAEYLFRCLTEVDAEGRATRRPRQLNQLEEIVGQSRVQDLRDVLEHFRAEGVSFLRPYAQERATPLPTDQVVDISHEALIRAWPQIADVTIDATGVPRGWLRREVEDGLIWRFLAVQAKQFVNDRNALLDTATTGRMVPWFDRLGANAAWAQRHIVSRAPGPAEAQLEWKNVRDLVAASVKARKRVLRQRRLNLAAIWSAGILAILAMAASYLSTLTKLETVETSLNDVKQAQVSDVDREQQRTQILAGSTPTPAIKVPVAQGDFPAPAGAIVGYLWLGSDGDATISTEGGRATPSQAKAGEAYILTTPVYLRGDFPSRTYALSPEVLAPIPAGTRLTLMRDPVAYRRPTRVQYWAKVAADSIKPTVFLQYFSEADVNPHSDADTRKAANQLVTALAGQGYTAPGAERVAAARGLNEVRFFYSSDARHAALLSAQVQRNRPSSDPPRVVDFTKYPGEKPPRGLLEMWVDFSPISPPGVQQQRPAKY
ncbi:ATP-binding protein [Phenylobacterium sp.]|jgi:hypothetical protein|uniref:ATP-binding protein n=1 Tax=Phenylobacterium sp. TaxID=1871053 RepID=UPI0037C9EBD5